MAQETVIQTLNLTHEESNSNWEAWKQMFTLKDDSEEYNNYIKELVLKSKINNAKSLCLTCWCFLSSSQKDRHEPQHNTPQNILTPSHYSALTSFKKLAILQSKSKTIQGTLYFQPIALNPEPHMQIKLSNKTAKAAEEVKKQEDDGINEIIYEELGSKVKRLKDIKKIREKEQPIEIDLRNTITHRLTQAEEKTSVNMVNLLL